MNRGYLRACYRADPRNPPSRRAHLGEIGWSRMAVIATIISLAGFSIDSAIRLHASGWAGLWDVTAGILVGWGVVAFFLISALVYQITRLGYLQRVGRHRPIPAHALERDLEGPAPSLAILVPSYMEEPSVIRRTLLAAALQQSPNRRVVLLIDDPPRSADPAARARLAAARELPREIEAHFSSPCRRYRRELSEFEGRLHAGAVRPRAEAERLEELWIDAAARIEALAEGAEARDHYDTLFIERILKPPARAHRARAGAWRAAPRAGAAGLLREYRRLAALFDVEVTSFERKRYANLSHAPSKAMNLNAYLALLGRGFREELSWDGRILAPAGGADASLLVPDADFVIVLDADSVILPEYSLRLVHFMSRPGNERIAVVQTPYASVPGASSTLERIAGATTDVQLMAHQGSTRHGAGSWVGASALVRHAALEDIGLTREERGYPVRIFVRDRTLTEDTDTTVALIRREWRVHNYAERLAHSATPPDFGALLIQRRRWATGGLVILADLWRYVTCRPTRARIEESVIRTQYILGAPVGSIGLAVLLLWPFAPDTAWTPWVLPGLVAWLACYGRDLIHNGGRASDLLRAAALNAMLLPVNLAGALHSIGQLWTGRRIPFQRTPKVQNRTTAPPLHIAAQIGLLLFVATRAQSALASGRWGEAAFYVCYAAGFAYALHVFIGWRAALDDLALGLGQRLRARIEQLRDGLATARRRMLHEE